MLNVENIQLKYGDISVIHDASFTVEKCEIVSLIGGNGNGKSTILKGLSGILPPAAGRITFDGQDITKARAHSIVALGMSLVPEGKRLFANLNVHKNLLLGAFLTKDKNEIEKRLEYVFGIFPILKERIQQKAGTLSGGEQQMLAIGRGLMSKPKLLLLDEPSWGIAPKLVDKIFEVIREIRKDGVTILLVEQNVQEALEICDRAYVLQTGRIVMTGTGKELLSSDLIRKAFLGL
ncbi:MAG TPA: ABC transporter ATP-binding protein [Syntrophales bacterium]|nr:ABC transporter ATP-binding protein [Syntrophales bacterium]